MTKQLSDMKVVLDAYKNEMENQKQEIEALRKREQQSVAAQTYTPVDGADVYARGGWSTFGQPGDFSSAYGQAGSWSNGRQMPTMTSQCHNLNRCRKHSQPISATCSDPAGIIRRGIIELGIIPAEDAKLRVTGPGSAHVREIPELQTISQRKQVGAEARETGTNASSHEYGGIRKGIHAH